MRQQDLVRVRLRGEDGLCKPGLQLQQPGAAEAASKIHQRSSSYGKGQLGILASILSRYAAPFEGVIKFTT